MIHAGIGETQLNNFLSSLNVHCIDAKTLKIRENEAGSVLENQAIMSQQRHLQMEILNSTTEDQTDSRSGICISTDTCWQKKGSGRSYNSLSGVSTLIGKTTGKVVNHKVRISSCRICERAKGRGILPRQHKCRKNWSGSAKGMEPDMVVEMLKELDEKGVDILEVVGDDDSTGFDRAKRLMPNSKMEKISDKNHIKHNIISKINELKPKHKELTGMNVGNPSGIEDGLHASIKHIFGEHDNCNETWCGYLKDKDSYIHSNLPRGKDLCSSELRSDLEKLFIQKMVPQSKKLSNLGSSQANESFNNLIALKAPKTKHFSTSASFKLQSQLSRTQKNEGYNYISELNTSIGLSPGNETLSRGNKLNKKREGNKNIFKSKQGKKQRKFLKRNVYKKTVAEVKEGEHTTVQSVIILILTERLEDFATIDIEEIPAIPEAETFTNIDDAPIVCFDLETTGLSRYSDITQIAACTKDSSFSRYIFPDQQISREASEITKITVVGQKMYYKDSLNLFKLVSPGLSSYSQYFLVDKLLGQQYESHNAVYDTKLLFNLVTEKGNVSQYISELAFSPSYPQLYQMQLANLKTFEKLVQSKCLSKAMALKTVRSNLRFQHFKLAVQRNDMAGLKALMTEKSSTGVVRVTSNKKIIQRVYEYLISLK
ncbi:unnamed protein product [Mytilus coruscus]|uniref:Exonuclease domain-containing protein n=1 Tax=Mytilus coruscus TaxID=42192 RepID=A0A6J8D1L9_MYTCO|nr:unnamed protein product [Mytilus coruscus]